ncbi:MAG: aldo/keto reductase [Gemmatimonadota bacterium]
MSTDTTSRDTATRSHDIPTKELPQGVEIPVLGLGSWQLTGSTCRRTVAEGLEMGYRHLDTAEAYENEKEVGRGLADSGVDRDDVFLTTKVWYENLAPDAVHAACEDSLDRLGTDYVDLYLIHWPTDRVPLSETVGALKELRDEGRIRAWGVCNFTRSWLEELLELGRPATNQIEIHPFLVQDELFDACRGWGIPLTAYSPLARGRVTGDRVLKEIGEAHGKTAAQVALRWSLDRGRIVIPKSSGKEHLRENFDVFGFSLDDEELDRIDALDAGERIIDPSWMDFEER